MYEFNEIRVGGHSIAGLETCIDFPQWKLTVDIGRCPAWAIARPTVLFTHAHMDHMGGVAMHAAMRAMRGMPAPTYLMPEVNVEAFEKMIDAWRVLDGSDLPHKLVPISPGEEHLLPNGLIVRPFRSPHRTTCQGYAIYRKKKVLKPEHRGATQAELNHLRLVQGQDITEPIETCEAAITGDSRIDVVDNVEAVREARLLVMEMTALDERFSLDKCHAGGHIHLDQVAERAELFNNENILLTHFSDRYNQTQIREALESKLPASLLSRVTPLLEGFRRGE